MEAAGVLFLTAGYGTRAEPLSLVRPKCLLPYGGTTVLGFLAERIRCVNPAKVRINASRCPDEILLVLYEVWSAATCELYFEERPLGVTATLARHACEMSTGTWIVANTDMVMPELDMEDLLESHLRTGASWTVLAGELPEDEGYSPLEVDEEMGFGAGGDGLAHYTGVSIMEPSVFGTAAGTQAAGGLFTDFAPHLRRSGEKLMICPRTGAWLDMGRLDLLRENILSAGSFIHPSACVSSDAVLEGTWNIGKGCMLGSGTVLRDSVMLEGSSLERGSLQDSILPWSCSSGDGRMI